MANKKYSEDQILNEISDYIEGTYNQHYVGIDEIQTLDVWESLGIADAMCVGTAIKYLMRFGKKEGRNRKDILKSIHFLVLLLHYEDKRKRAPSAEDALKAQTVQATYEEKFPKIPVEDEDPATPKMDPKEVARMYREVFEQSGRHLDWIRSFTSEDTTKWPISDDPAAPDLNFVIKTRAYK